MRRLIKTNGHVSFWDLDKGEIWEAMDSFGQPYSHKIDRTIDNIMIESKKTYKYMPEYYTVSGPVCVIRWAKDDPETVNEFGPVTP